MDEGQLLGSLAWIGVGVGYAWTVRKLASMARPPRATAADWRGRSPAGARADQPSGVPSRRQLRT